MKDLFMHFYPKYIEMHKFRKSEIILINSLKDSPNCKNDTCRYSSLNITCSKQELLKALSFRKQQISSIIIFNPGYTH